MKYILDYDALTRVAEPKMLSENEGMPPDPERIIKNLKSANEALIAAAGGIEGYEKAGYFYTVDEK